MKYLQNIVVPPYQFVRYFINYVRIIHSPPVVWPYRFDVQTRLILAQRQIIVHLVVGYRFYCCRSALPRLRYYTLLSIEILFNTNFSVYFIAIRFEKKTFLTEYVDFIVIFLRVRLIMPIDHVSGVTYAQFEKYRFLAELFVDHRRVQNGHEQKKFLVSAVRRLKIEENKRRLTGSSAKTRLGRIDFTSVIGYVGSTSTPEFINSVFSVISVRIATNTLALYETPSPSPVLSVACLSKML